MTIYFNIAGYIINITFGATDWPEKKNLLITLTQKYFGGFMVPKQKISDAKIVINEISGIPFVVTKGKSYSQCFKKVMKNTYETYYHISIFELSQLLMIVLIDLLKTDGFLLHATGVKTKKGIVIFTGESGSGKSTALEILSKRHSPFADDCVVIKKVRNKYMCYQVPWINKNNLEIEQSSLPEKILHIYTVKRSSTFNTTRMSTSQLLYEVTKNAWVINTLSKKTIISISRFIDSKVKGSMFCFDLESKNNIISEVSRMLAD